VDEVHCHQHQEHNGNRPQDARYLHSYRAVIARDGDMEHFAIQRQRVIRAFHAGIQHSKDDRHRRGQNTPRRAQLPNEQDEQESGQTAPP